VLGRFDANKNGRLESQETQSLGMPVAQIDVDRDGDLTREELHAFLSPLQDAAGNEAEGIPGWFYELDADRDRQVSMSEFATDWTDERMQQFASLDANSDGFLTSLEVTRSKAMMGGSYSNRTAEVLPPGRTIVSEIEVDDDFVVGDVNVHLSITHTNTSHLDAYLTGPDGQRIELFTEVGGRDDNFDGTIFDDQSQFPITKARPPFKGTFIPEGLLKRQPSLSSFNGKNAQGIWQLVIRATRSDRFGMLHSWSVHFKPQEEMLGQAATAPVNDGPQIGQTSSWPVQRVPEPESRSSDARSESRYEPAPRAKVDYEAIGKRMEEAVKSGKMTDEQVKQAWIAFKSRARGESKKGEKDGRDEWRSEGDRGSKKKDDALKKKEEKSKSSREEAIERYKMLMQSKRSGEGD
jgi:subtilisin-like proprotein convertase family protein/Ca2+-binding EF-hand superfamily protein